MNNWYLQPNAQLWKKEVRWSDKEDFYGPYHKVILWVWRDGDGKWVLDVMRNTKRAGMYLYGTKEEAMAMGDIILQGLL